ncbi:MAG TPA: nucleoside-diphosphate kinase [Polyangiaceae bacterium]|nr:nucleoside-diphosphate kinase [Polyangiaceae bacterium]
MERTLCIIKPDAWERRVSGHILQRILDEGFTVLGMQQIQLTLQQAEGFYEVHKERPFYSSLCSFMTRGKVIVIALEREGAVAHWRKVIGATDPAKAEPNTLRKLFAKSMSENAVHGSDSVENGIRECAFFFPEGQLLSQQ